MYEYVIRALILGRSIFHSPEAKKGTTQRNGEHISLEFNACKKRQQTTDAIARYHTSTLWYGCKWYPSGYRVLVQNICDDVRDTKTKKEEQTTVDPQSVMGKVA